MTSHYRTRAGIGAALAVASLTAATPAGADPNPAQRVQSSRHGAALAQELYYTSHKPSIPAAGHDFRTIDARDSDAISAPRYRARTIDEPPRANGFEWGDAAIGAGGVLGLVLAFAGGAAAITRRNRPAEGLEMS